MNKPKLDIFIDTSILIHGFLRAETKRRKINQQLSSKRVITCSVVLHEYKRRVLREAAYLITLFLKKDNIAEVRDHVTNVLQKQHGRKKVICLDILDNIIGDLASKEQRDRAITYLHTFIKRGLRSVQKIIDLEFDTIECACARYSPKVVKPYMKYEFGPLKCEGVRDECGIVKYMEANKETILGLIDFLSSKQGQFTKEMESIYLFLEGTATTG